MDSSCAAGSADQHFPMRRNHAVLAHAVIVSCSVVAGSLLAQAQTTAPPLPGATLVVENARVAVWDVTHGAGEIASGRLDSIRVALTGRIGDVVFTKKNPSRQPPAAASGQRSILVELKDAAVRTIPNKSGYPNAFPRPGVKHVLENDRVVVWDYTWTPGNPTPMHFHDKDVVVTYLADGELLSTTPDGEKVNNPHHFGFSKFNPRDRVHTETLVKGEGRAIIVELK